jgi:c-di-GMP-related signal transduction protein
MIFKGLCPMEIYVARQPIFKKDKTVFGYELLFRNGTSNFFTGIDGNTATSNVLSNSYFSIGIENISGNNLSFINFTRDLLVKQTPQLFSKDKLAVEVLEDIEPDEEVVKACTELSHKGYLLALDDFFYHAGMKPLIEVANIIKFDFRATKADQIKKIIEKLSKYHLKFLAEKIETHKEFKIALNMGFEYFQGYFFSKPEIIKGKDISSAQLNLLQVMAEVNKADFSFNKVEAIIARDVAISYKLMRYINSAYFRRASKLSSINQAIVLLGENGIKNFLSLIAMTKLIENKPDELLRSSIIRAKFCERVGEKSGSCVSPSEFFTLGLFSSIDAVLDDTMENLMSKLPLSDDLKKALIHGEGVLSDYLKLAMCYEKGDWEGVSKYSEAIHMDGWLLPKIFIDAVIWADTIISA